MSIEIEQTNVTGNMTLGDLVDTHPLASKVLIQHGLDFCCGGRSSLTDACEASGLDVNGILEEIQSTHANTEERRWSEATTEELVAHILDAYHEPLPEMLAHLQEMMTRVFERHGPSDPQRIGTLQQMIVALANELPDHTAKEEQVLFPLILSKSGLPPTGPIRCMLMEHDRAGAILNRIVELTDCFTVPEGACTTWRGLYAGLRHLDHELRLHIHLENNVLFPRLVR